MSLLSQSNVIYLPYFPYSPNYIANSSMIQNYSMRFPFFNTFYYPFSISPESSGFNLNTNQIPNHILQHPKISSEKLEKCQGETISIIKNCYSNFCSSPSKSFAFNCEMKTMIRSKPFTLSEALEAIMKYKQEYHRLKREKQKYISQTACKNLKLNKKTLDDYQMYIRLGIHLNLIQKDNLHQSFGAFRRSVKAKKVETNAKWAKPRDQDIEEFYHSLISLT